jgi:hypothetical protein
MEGVGGGDIGAMLLGLGAALGFGLDLGLAAALALRAGAAFFAAAFLGAAFLRAALARLLAGRAFFFALLRRTPALFALRPLRFFALAFFFAMSVFSCGCSAPRHESSPEKVRCHLRSKPRERAHACWSRPQGFRTLPGVLPSDTIRPLHDVWLRPRRVFRALAQQPVGARDFALGAAQGVVGTLVMSRLVSAGAHASVLEILMQALLTGSLSGLISLFLLAEIYVRLGASAGGRSTRPPVIHVLTYGGTPIVASLGVWLLIALLAGPATFMKAAPADAEGFLVVLLNLPIAAFSVLSLWSAVLQVMGFSEIQQFGNRKAFLLWLLGQLLAFIASLLLRKLIGG